MWWAWPSLAFLPYTITTPRGPKPFRRASASAAVGGGHIVTSHVTLDPYAGMTAEERWESMVENMD